MFGSVALSGVGPGTGAATAEPLDLRDPTPRWIQVRFEVSPREWPDRLDATYSPPLAAWFEPIDEGRVQVRVPGRAVEQSLLRNAKPGTLSDFVWVFDARSGDVLSATLSGTVIERLDWGFFDTHSEIAMRLEMATTRRAGFRAPFQRLGQMIFRYCTPKRSGASCRLVPALPYDRQTGYVNAIGALSARAHGIDFHTFSPLGETVWSEVEPLTRR